MKLVFEYLHMKFLINYLMHVHIVHEFDQTKWNYVHVVVQKAIRSFSWKVGVNFDGWYAATAT